MKKTKTIIVEDEQKNMDNFLKKYCPSIEIVAKCLTFDEAHALNSKKIDLVFFRYLLDKNTSFDLLEQSDFQIVFTTAFDEYAIQAFKYNTVDYLLKPIAIKELIDVVSRAENRIEQNKGRVQTDFLNLQIV